MSSRPAHRPPRASPARRELLWRLASIAAISAAPAGTRAATDPFVTWMQMLHDQWAVPAYETLDRSAAGLVTVLEAAMAAGGKPTPGQLKEGQALWLQAMLSWRRLEALQMGPTLARRSSKAIDFWPTRPKVIQQAATITATAPMSGPAANDAMERWAPR